MSDRLGCFKAYDVRGRVPDELNDDIAYRIGRAYAAFLKPSRVAVGHDIRLSSPAMTDSLIRGLTEGGADVFHIGQGGTEEIYHAAFDMNVDGGIMVTASHNPKNYNGMKFVREGSRPISGDTGLNEIGRMAALNEFPAVSKVGAVSYHDNSERYVEHLCGYVDAAKLKPLKIVVDPGNGGAGKIISLLEKHLPFTFIKIHFEPDGNFPNGVPNPLLPENRAATAAAVREHGADMGLAWDGDFDRCFFFDEQGEFIEGYYLVGLLAQAFLQKEPGAKIIHDPRLTWNTVDVVGRNGGIAVQSKTGHAFIKERMRHEDAVYGGEMSAHHYFREFAYCDSGMIPWLMVAQLVSVTGKSLSRHVEEAMRAYPASGEINRRVQDAKACIRAVREVFEPQALRVDETDGISLEFPEWRFNLRSSNTEPVLRLNVESRGDKALMEDMTRRLLEIIDAA
ncbi:phosphomannomutase [Desulfovibrio mangrovi]|uniref:phosphomannomutase n=1 Tax=Desulfovibrio mangrovi TaxID=2976983 RepID=UPI002246CFF3|nr:phosphomannomutase [Desulfovibrio mangrovi]UZP67530.1 phosphomannomutase [Desulfovibrio mangrovi]